MTKKMCSRKKARSECLKPWDFGILDAGNGDNLKQTRPGNDEGKVLRP